MCKSFPSKVLALGINSYIYIEIKEIVLYFSVSRRRIVTREIKKIQTTEIFLQIFFYFSLTKFIIVKRRLNNSIHRHIFFWFFLFFISYCFCFFILISLWEIFGINKIKYFRAKKIFIQVLLKYLKLE